MLFLLLLGLVLRRTPISVFLFVAHLWASIEFRRLRIGGVVPVVVDVVLVVVLTEPRKVKVVVRAGRLGSAICLYVGGVTTLSGTKDASDVRSAEWAAPAAGFLLSSWSPAVEGGFEKTFS